jgi:Putative Flp pilus-assembly TadE/G-like
MNLRNFLLKHLQIFTGRVYKNYQGQVAIFVALIFQVIFILFALMINVGLLVHHKINLQQSADLAAYYGATKQAEMLNVVAHVNFQIRQAYKLLTWRYRILGTFGFINPGSGTRIEYPITQTNTGYAYNPLSQDFTCSNVNVSPTEIPFMCLNHFGFSDYNAPPGDPARPTLETFCQANCERFNGLAITINQLQGANTSGGGIHDVAVVGAINSAIANANANVAAACRASGPTTLALLSKFYASYLQDTRNKMQFIRMMMANLSVEEKEQKDLEGKKVYDGVFATFKNNLTEANNTSMGKDDNVFDTLNSLSPTYGGECHYDNVSYRQKATETTPAVALFSEINFAFINYFILKCTQTNANDKEFKAQSIYDLQNTPNLDAGLLQQVTAEAGTTLADQIKDIMEQNSSSITMGIEKNPWCGVYYGVKASSTPIIPFLPISKIKLHASAFAQPFGGSIGPRAFKEWAPDKNKSDASGGTMTQVDRLMPIQNMYSSDPIVTLKDNVKLLLNYSNYVGDTKGLSDPQVVAVYHDMLLNRSVAAATAPGPNVSTNKLPEPMQGNKFAKPQIWPAYKEWNHLSTLDLSNDLYDPLARSASGQNAFMRDIELSVVAPNQFEAAYYSIEPDFYNVYVKDKLKNSISDLQSKVGITSRIYVPKDFGNTTTSGGQSAVGGTPDNFGVRNQLAVVHHVMRNASPSGLPSATNYNFTGSGVHSEGISTLAGVYFKYIPFLPGSLLTSWTMKDMFSDDYSIVTQEDTKMPFGKCLDEGVHGNDGYGSMAGQPDPRGGSDPLPAAPGNCVSGGRTGYSVKLVSPSSLFGDRRLVGGSNVGPLRNQPTGFVSFQ